MEVKITISDTTGGSGANPVSVEISGAGSSAANPQAGAAQTTVQPERNALQELLQRAGAIGAINAGPAPNLSSGGETGAPLPFVSANSDILASAASGQPAGPAPGSEALMETFTVKQQSEE